MSLLVLGVSILTLVIEATFFLGLLLTFQSWMLVYRMKWRGFMHAMDFIAIGFCFFALFYFFEYLLGFEILSSILLIISCSCISYAAFKAFWNIKDLVIVSD